MPITRYEFDNGEKSKDDSSSRVLEFLRKNADSAFNIDEITAGISWQKSSRIMSRVEQFRRNPSDTLPFKLNLQELVQKRLIDEKHHKGKPYYSIHKI
jgi:hypothetical protein